MIPRKASMFFGGLSFIMEMWDVERNVYFNGRELFYSVAACDKRSNGARSANR